MIQLALRLLTRYSHVNWALADQAMISGVNFLTAILLARYLGLEEFGHFTLAWMAVLFVNSLQHAMIVAPMMSIGPKQRESDSPAYFGAAINQQILFAVAVFVLLLVGAELSSALFPGWGVERLGFPLAFAAFFSQLQEFLRRYFFTRGRARTAFVNDIIRYLGQLITIFLLFQVTSMDSVKTLWAISATAAAATVSGMLFVKRIAWDLRAVRAITKLHWNFAKWLVGSAFLQWTSGYFFIVAAGGLLGVAAVGALKAAQTLMGITHILFFGLENVVPIRAARHFRQGGNKALLTYLQKVALAGGLGVAAIGAIAAAAPGFWLELFFGSEYSQYGYILQWFAAAYVVSFMGLPLRAGLRALEHTRPIFSAYQWTTLFTFVSAYPIIKFLGLSGAAVGFLMAQGILVAGLMIGLRKQLSKK